MFHFAVVSRFAPGVNVSVLIKVLSLFCSISISQTINEIFQMVSGKLPPSKFLPGIFPLMFLNIPTRVFKSSVKKIVACRPKFDNRSLF